MDDVARLRFAGEGGHTGIDQHKTLAAGVAPENPVGHRRAAAEHAQNPASVDGRRVSTQRAVGHRPLALDAAVPPVAVVSRVSAEGVVGHRWATAPLVVHLAAPAGLVSAGSHRRTTRPPSQAV